MSCTPNRTIGRDGGIRTRDPLTPSQVRYQAALHPVMRLRAFAFPSWPSVPASSHVSLRRAAWPPRAEPTVSSCDRPSKIDPHGRSVPTWTCATERHDATRSEQGREAWPGPRVGTRRRGSSEALFGRARSATARPHQACRARHQFPSRPIRPPAAPLRRGGVWLPPASALRRTRAA